MKSLTKLVNESKTSRREIANYISSWINQSYDVKEVKEFFDALIEGLNDGLDEMNKFANDDESVEKCERASEVIEQFEYIVKKTF